NKFNKVTEWEKTNRLFEQLLNQVEKEFKGSLSGFDAKNNIVILIPKFSDEPYLNKKLEDIIRGFTSIYNLSNIYGGIGRIYSFPENVTKSYRESQICLNMAVNDNKETNDNNLVFSFSELNVERILFSNNPMLESKRLASEVLGKIIKHDIERNSDLLNTLKSYINNNANYHNTAKELFVHRNTVRYRLELIKDITGFDPEILQDQLLFHLALMYPGNEKEDLIE